MDAATHWLKPGDYWLARLALQKSIGLLFLTAYLNVINQFKPLLGERGLLPVPLFVKDVAFRESPSLFFFFPTDKAFTICGWIGVVLSGLIISGFADQTWSLLLIWAALWVLYLSFVNVGQVFYGFGWESILLEAGAYAAFLAGSNTTAQPAVMWLFRWLLFRVMFGAGLIKLRGDPCWRDLTCLDYHYETQPIPNPLSWFFHHGPKWSKSGGVLFNHFAELIVPFGYFLPQPVASIAGVLTIVFQLLIFLSGNLSWLNILTLCLTFSCFDDRTVEALLIVHTPITGTPDVVFRVLTGAILVLVVILSIKPVRNLLSSRQVMNTVYNRFHFVGTYGAFGGITRERYEIAVEGTDESVITASTKWREYEFKGKPGDPSRLPPQIAPYHLRLDWLMWFAAMSSYHRHAWFVHFLAKLLAGDKATLALLRKNPFVGAPPRYVRAVLYLYRFCSPPERKATGLWWVRKPMGSYFPTVSLQTPALRSMLQQTRWTELE
ncbi:MAG TPA: lipase maturation factor family protein [Terriglobales bacterium]|nr:lipase maturation factor family protein [Terriglobales bacterium]